MVKKIETATDSPNEISQEVTDPYLRSRNILTVIHKGEPDRSQKTVQEFFAQAFVRTYRAELLTRVLGVEYFDPPKPSRKAAKKKPG